MNPLQALQAWTPAGGASQKNLAQQEDIAGSFAPTPYDSLSPAMQFQASLRPSQHIRDAAESTFQDPSGAWQSLYAGLDHLKAKGGDPLSGLGAPEGGGTPSASQPQLTMPPVSMPQVSMPGGDYDPFRFHMQGLQAAAPQPQQPPKKGVV